jgi:hypothetical protein
MCGKVSERTTDRIRITRILWNFEVLAVKVGERQAGARHLECTSDLLLHDREGVLLRQALNDCAHGHLYTSKDLCLRLAGSEKYKLKK